MGSARLARVAAQGDSLTLLYVFTQGDQGATVLQMHVARDRGVCVLHHDEVFFEVAIVSVSTSGPSGSGLHFVAPAEGACAMAGCVHRAREHAMQKTSCRDTVVPSGVSG